MHEANRSGPDHQHYLARDQIEHFLSSHHAGQWLGKSGCFETGTFLPNRVNVFVGGDGKIFVSAVGKLRVKTAILSSPPTVHTYPTFDDKIDHYPLADLQVLYIFAQLSDFASCLVAHYARQRDALLTRVNPDVPGTDATVRNPNHDLLGASLINRLLAQLEFSWFKQPRGSHL
jgi:hypothetical protein